MNQNLLADWVLETLNELAKNSPFGEGRVQLGFGFDGFFLPKEIVISLFEKVRALGIKVITTHFVKGALMGKSHVSFRNSLTLHKHLWTAKKISNKLDLH